MALSYEEREHWREYKREMVRHGLPISPDEKREFIATLRQAFEPTRVEIGRALDAARCARCGYLFTNHYLGGLCPGVDIPVLDYSRSPMEQTTAPPPEMKTFASGAKSTVKKPLYHLIPLIALRLLAERFGYGASRHGERNYRKGADDLEFVNDRTNHLFEHVQRYAETRSREDLAAILCNAAILADVGAFVGSGTPLMRTFAEQLEQTPPSAVQE